ncbi:Ulp1 protease family, C-terminal catalytic domain [Sesbania bispinosa]|nr:Ulp1 protease family, C-terminal catalytic domain [Sesbania bispinosa]
MEYYQEDYMGKVEDLSKIFIPMNDDNMHWYLLVVDIRKEHLILLDSMPCAMRDEWRSMDVTKVAKFIEGMLVDDSFYKNDCGVWVARWMVECGWTDDYNTILVNNTTRMRTAIELVLNPYNEIKEAVQDRAVKYLKSNEEYRRSLVKK